MKFAALRPRLWGIRVASRVIARVWAQRFPAEQQRIFQLLVERVILQEEGIEIRWREMGWQTLVGEMRPGTIGAELIELEALA